MKHIIALLILSASVAFCYDPLNAPIGIYAAPTPKVEEHQIFNVSGVAVQKIGNGILADCQYVYKPGQADVARQMTVYIEKYPNADALTNLAPIVCIVATNGVFTYRGTDGLDRTVPKFIFGKMGAKK